MITLAVLTYIAISLMIAVRRSFDDYSTIGKVIKAKKPVPALIEGFLTLPVMALIIVVGYLIIYYTFQIFVAVVSWIFYNMP